MSAENQKPSPYDEQPRDRGHSKKKRRYFWLTSAIVLVLVILVAMFVIFWGGFLFNHGQVHNLTSFNEHLVIYYHTASGTQTQTIDMSLGALAGKYPVGQQMWVEIPYHYSGTGTMNITSMSCTTPGFSFSGTLPALPVKLPNTPTVQAGNITLRIFFNTPSTPYTGPFDFTVYYDQYP